MKKRSLPFLFVCLLILNACTFNHENGPIELALNQNWSFKAANQNDWMPAEVPGCVHTDLIANGKIEDPFYRLNEHDVQWIDKKDWEYRSTFHVEKSMLEKDKLELCFEGLDTYAEVSLNGKLILSTDNMFRSFTVDAKSLLKVGENEMRIVFRSPINQGIAKYDALAYEIPVGDNDLAEIGQVEGNKKVCIFTRKAQYHFGWDWGPRLVTSGIWKPIKLKGWNTAKIQDFYFKNEKIQDAKASCELEMDIEATTECSPIFELKANGEIRAQLKLNLKPGPNKITVPFLLKNVKLWWPNGMGDQHLYHFDLSLLKGKQVLSSRQFEKGFRTIELIQEADDMGKSFEFQVNGIPTFCKGVNYIPQDIFLNRVTPADYERIIKAAADANMNMIRVWGGGIYERAIFYELCDKYGLMVWQDFMFACAMYPGDAAFLENVKQEAIDNIKRLRNHACLALWCGNNEVMSAWHQWNWKNEAIEKQGPEIMKVVDKAHTTLFFELLADVVKQYDGARSYWPSSPMADNSQPSDWDSGDYHYWGVWWGKEPFENYNIRIPRFMSEFGFQSFPELNSVKKYTLPEDWDIYSEVMKSHQRSSIGNGTIDEYMNLYYHKPKDFEQFLYVGQVLQAKGISLAIKAHRRNRERCMGSIYWQINDCWPVASWSSIDYYGNWKAVHYAVRDAFKKTIVSGIELGESLEVYTITDSLQNIDGWLNVSVYDFNGNKISSFKQALSVAKNASKKYATYKIAELLGGKKKDEVFATLQITDKDHRILDRELHYFVQPKDLTLPKVNLTTEVAPTENGHFVIRIRSDKLAKNVYIQPNVDGHLSKNYFDLQPNKPVELEFIPSKSMDVKALKKSLKLSSLVDSY